MKSLIRPVFLAFLASAAFAGCKRPANFQEVTALDPTTHDPYFPIAQGNHANTNCNACHGAFDTFEQFDCLDCHKAEETTPRHRGLTDYKWESPACLACHPRGEADGAGNHDVIFPIGATAKHADAACTSCHVDPADRKQVDCLSCHEHAAPAMAHAHTLVGGFEQASAQCLRCHADSQVNPVATHVPVPIHAGGEHFQQSCLACHPDLRADKPFGADFKRSDCLGCHTKPETDPAHVAIDGYAWTNASCLLCHPNGEGGAVDHTRYFPIGAGSIHAAASCTSCHTNPSNRTVVTCNGCHEHAQATSSSQHTQVGGYQWTSSLCLRCHADSQVDRVPAHTRFPIAREAKHWRESCITCHPRFRTDRPWGADFSTFRCVGCHANDHREDPQIRAEGDAGCYRCHPRGDD